VKSAYTSDGKTVDSGHTPNHPLKNVAAVLPGWCAVHLGRLKLLSESKIFAAWLRPLVTPAKSDLAIRPTEAHDLIA
jgi:hypothetical protein